MTTTREDTRPTTLVETFEWYANSQGWDTHKGSTGKCWFIAHAFALHAAEQGHAVEMWKASRPNAPRPAELQHYFVVVNGWAVDFASRGALGREKGPWPLVRPTEEYLSDFAERLPACPTCGSGGDPHPGEPCPGFVPVDQHLDRARKQAGPALLDALRAGTSLTRAEALAAIQNMPSETTRRRRRQRSRMPTRPPCDECGKPWHTRQCRHHPANPCVTCGEPERWRCPDSHPRGASDA